MNYLENIVRKKRAEIKALKDKIPLSFLEKASLFNAEKPSFYEHLCKPGPSIIAEFKRRSPSKGVLNKNADIIKIVKAYEDAGARAVSVLTDEYFDGRSPDVSAAFEIIDIPLLRKDFIIDEFQVYEARAIGASAILLIAAILEKNEIEELTALAESMGMDVLLEIHSKDELHKISPKNKIIGINNRDLKSFEVNLDRSKVIASELDRDIIKISESGISSVDNVIDLYRTGFQAFLIGETFMKTSDPGKTASEFINELNKKLSEAIDK